MIRSLVFLVFLVLSSMAQAQDIESIRLQYPKAEKDSVLTNQLYLELQNTSESDAILMAYKGGLSTLKAHFAKKIKLKKEYFQQGAQWIDSAIKIHPQNPELRYIRLSVQENAPKIVRYHQDIDADKKVLLETYPNLKSETLKAVIRDFVRTSSSFDETEIQTFL